MERVEIADRQIQESFSKADLDRPTIGWAMRRFYQGFLQKADLLQAQLLPIFRKREPIAIHEAWHEAGAKYFGWGVSSVTVVPEGNTLGSTKVTPNPSESPVELNRQAIVIAAMGEMGQKAEGFGYGGCGSDRFKQRLLGRVVKYLSRTEFSVKSIISEGRSKARSLVVAIGMNNIRARSFDLLRVGTIA